MCASLNAGVTAGRALKVYAVEKNPNAVITLRNRAIMDGWDNVTIVAKDMRQWVRRAFFFFCAERERGSLFVLPRGRGKSEKHCPGFLRLLGGLFLLLLRGPVRGSCLKCRRSEGP